MSPSLTRVACLDVGSTFTKLAVVEFDGTGGTGGALLAGTAAHPTTLDGDVLDGVDALLSEAGPVDRVLCCSSAGGGLRLAVVGYESLVSAEAAQRVALSAGARVVHVSAGPLGSLAPLRESAPDVVLLVGGTDGGDASVLLHNAARLAREVRLRVPIVLAGNVEARDEALALLRGRRVTVAGNVLPRIGVLSPQPARAAIREVFLRHVIGGKRLSKGPRFGRLVRAATPDAVLTGVEVLADTVRGDLLVVDVGGATTDVYSALTPQDTADVAGTLWRSRTVEGDLGVRWNVAGILSAAASGALPVPEDVSDLSLASLASVVAVRRHARSGRDLRDVRLVVASGGVFRHAPQEAAVAALAATVGDHAGGWALPRRPAIMVDRDYVLAPAGLLASAGHLDVAVALLRGHLHVR